MKKLILGLLMVVFVNATMAEVISDVQIGDLKYRLDTSAKTAAITGYDKSRSLTRVDVGEVEWQRRKYFVTSIQFGAFSGCSSLTSVSLPNATTIERNAFLNCTSLTTVVLGWDLLENPNRSDWGLRDEAELVGPITKEQTDEVGRVGACYYHDPRQGQAGLYAT